MVWYASDDVAEVNQNNFFVSFDFWKLFEGLLYTVFAFSVFDQLLLSKFSLFKYWHKIITFGVQKRRLTHENLRSVLCTEWQCFEGDHNLLLHYQIHKGVREQYTLLFVKRNASFLYYWFFWLILKCLDHAII